MRRESRRLRSQGRTAGATVLVAFALFRVLAACSGAENSTVAVGDAATAMSDAAMEKTDGPSNVTAENDANPGTDSGLAQDLTGFFNSVTAVVPISAGGCLPHSLSVGIAGEVPCLVVAQLPTDAGGTCLGPTCTLPALSLPEPHALASFCVERERAFQTAGAWDSGLVDPASQSACWLPQLSPDNNSADFVGPSCAASSDPGWCYVQGANDGCPQRIVFAPSTIPPGAMLFLQCSPDELGVDAGAD